MSEIEKIPSSPLEAQVAAALAEMRQEMEEAGARLEAMHAAGKLWGSPPARDLDVAVRATLSVACKGFSLLSDLQTALAQEAESPTTNYQAPSPEQYSPAQEASKQEKVEAAAGHVGDLVVVRIVAEAVIAETDTAAVKAEGNLLHQQLGTVAAENSVQVDVTTKKYIDPEQERRNSLLSKDLPTLFSDLDLVQDDSKIIRNKIITRLRDKHGITTLRDVLMHGETTIQQTHALGGSSIDFLKMAIAKTELGLTLSNNRLPMSDIIEICPTLEQLPAKFYYKDLASKLENRSVAEIIGMNRGRLAQLLATDGKPDLGTAFNLQNQLSGIASEFANAVADKATFT